MPSLANEADRSALEKRILELSADDRPLWGRMTPNQMVCHLTDQLRHALGERENPQKGNWFFHTIGKWLILYVAPIPRNVKTSPMADQEDGGTNPTEFEADRDKLLQYVRMAAEAPEDHGWAPHFRFGGMNKRQWCRFSHKHFDHHLRQFGR